MANCFKDSHFFAYLNLGSSQKIFNMRWKDLKIRAKIGSGFAVIMVVVITLGVVILYNLQKVDKGNVALTNVYIPVVREAVKLDKYWKETREYSRSYDFTGNVYFHEKADKSFEKMYTALKNLKRVLKGNEEIMLDKDIDLSLLEQHIVNFGKVTGQYYEKEKAANEAKHRFVEALQKMKNEAGGYGSGSHRVTSQLDDFVNQLVWEDNNQDYGSVEDHVSSFQVLNKQLRNRRFGAVFNQYMQSALHSLDEYLSGLRQTKILELKKFELAKSIMWDAGAASDVGLDLMMKMGDDNSTIVSLQKKIMLYALLVVFVMWVLLVYFLSKAISQPIEEGIEKAERLAKGDLSVEFIAHSKDEVGALSEALNTMVETLKSVIREVTMSSQEIIRASHKLNSGAMELSEGATEQASAAEEVSSSMEEMYANIQQNTDNSKETEKIASVAATGIQESNEASKVAANNINDIAEKISVISDIAFQTNILALNAAVEAARAGQEGRGFAVVAAEVRKLAERSQVAATEITKSSSETLNSSNEATDKLDSITPEIQKTAALVKEITLASMEQVTGVEQINNAIQQLNNVTQRNAANAEQIREAAAVLDKLSGQLSQSITMFNGEEAVVADEPDMKSNTVAGTVKKRQTKKDAKSFVSDESGYNIELGSGYDDYEKF